MTPQPPAAAPSDAAPITPPSAPVVRWHCLDCGVEATDLEPHANHALERVGGGEERVDRVRSVAIDELTHSRGYERISTGVRGFDLVLGGGLVRNGIVMIDGEPGIGKSTLLATVSGRIAARGGNVLYASGEETVDQLAACAARIGHVIEGVRAMHTSNLDDILREARVLRRDGWPVDLLIVDSAQAVRTATASGAVGSVHQVGAVTNDLRSFAKASNTSVILVSQVVKDGSAAGPNSAAHAVDALFSFGRDERDLRWLRSRKNRFGAVGEVAQFEMSSRGLVEVEDPSMGAWRELVGDPGVAGCVCAHLAKPVMVGVEALVTLDDDVSGGRSVQSQGYPIDRVKFILESLTRHAGVSFAKASVRVRVPLVAGDEVKDNALDFAVAAACWSSLTKASLGSAVFAGSVGLSGKMQTPPRLDARIEYSERCRASAVAVGCAAVKRSLPARVPVFQASHVRDLPEVFEKLREKKP